MGAVGVRDEAQLVYTRDESTHEAEVNECDEKGGAFGRGEADQGVDGPEDGDYADDEEYEDVGWGKDVGF